LTRAEISQAKVASGYPVCDTIIAPFFSRPSKRGKLVEVKMKSKNIFETGK
jgi:hypothetical protein